MWDQLTTFWSLDRAEKHYRLKKQPLNMPLGSQNPYPKRAIAKRAITNLNSLYLEDEAHSLHESISGFLNGRLFLANSGACSF